LPLCLLYEVGLVVASLMARQGTKPDTELQKDASIRP
jgi:Sec-independent protein secretion pathway component TatC